MSVSKLVSNITPLDQIAKINEVIDDLVVVDQTYDASSTNPQSGTAVAGAISTKQDTIDDLETIRAGATSGASALQPSDVSSTYSATGTVPINGTAVASALSSYVTTSTQINGQSLSGNITLTASDVSALPSDTSIPTITFVDFTV